MHYVYCFSGQFTKGIMLIKYVQIANVSTKICIKFNLHNITHILNIYLEYLFSIKSTRKTSLITSQKLVRKDEIYDY